MINYETFCEILDKVLTKVLTTKPDQAIMPDETFSNYGLDSLDQMNMLLEIEDEVKINAEDINIKESDTPTKLHQRIVELSGK